ncbi:RHS repeat-associated core domain-containing protein [Paenibacillus tarimensis]
MYDVENRLVEVKNSSGTSLASFTYNHEGKRNSMTTSSGPVYFHYSGDKVIYETDINNSIVSEYTWDENGNPISMTKNGSTYFYHINGRGDVTSLTDAIGTIVAQYQYDASGNIISETGTLASTNPYRYAGYRYDEATGLYYLNARYYDANIGRFITEDTFKGTEDEPLTLNSYTYVLNNPVGNIDTTGNWCESADGKWAHPGRCSDPTSKYSSDWWHYGDYILANGVVVGVYGFLPNLYYQFGGIGKGRLGLKGKTFRGGPKSSRDKWYGYNDKEFQKWWHRVGKKEWGGGDLDNAQDAKDAYQYWLSLGKPRVK